MHHRRSVLIWPFWISVVSPECLSSSSISSDVRVALHGECFPFSLQRKCAKGRLGGKGFLLAYHPGTDRRCSLVKLPWKFRANQWGHREDDGHYEMLTALLEPSGRKETIRRHDKLCSWILKTELAKNSFHSVVRQKLSIKLLASPN